MVSIQLIKDLLIQDESEFIGKDSNVEKGTGWVDSRNHHMFIIVRFMINQPHQPSSCDHSGFIHLVQKSKKSSHTVWCFGVWGYPDNIKTPDTHWINLASNEWLIRPRLESSHSTSCWNLKSANPHNHPEFFSSTTQQKSSSFLFKNSLDLNVFQMSYSTRLMVVCYKSLGIVKKVFVIFENRLTFCLDLVSRMQS